jgi:hypothetical protein
MWIFKKLCFPFLTPNMDTKALQQPTWFYRMPSLQIKSLSLSLIWVQTLHKNWMTFLSKLKTNCYNPTLRECEDETHTPEMRTWESSGTPESSQFDCKGQNTLHWNVLYIIGKLSKSRCRKWSCLSHLDIYSTSCGQKKGRESNWQFDSRPLKVGNRPNPDACRSSGTHRWKALSKSYNFVSDLTLIRGLNKEL